MENNIPRVKIVLVGAYNSGKTTLLIRYLEQKMDYEGYIPPIFDTSEVTVNIENNKSAKVELWDTAGEEQRGSQWRSLGYPQTDLFFICYSVVVSDEPLTLQRIEFFTQEIKEKLGSVGEEEGVSVYLVGLRSDLREDREEIAKMTFYNTCKEMKIFTRKEGEKMARKIGAVKYMECSSKTGEGVNELFIDAIRYLCEKNSSALKI